MLPILTKFSHSCGLVAPKINAGENDLLIGEQGGTFWNLLEVGLGWASLSKEEKVVLSILIRSCLRL